MLRTPERRKVAVLVLVFAHSRALGALAGIRFQAAVNVDLSHHGRKRHQRLGFGAACLAAYAGPCAEAAQIDAPSGPSLK